MSGDKQPPGWCEPLTLYDPDNADRVRATYPCKAICVRTIPRTKPRKWSTT